MCEESTEHGRLLGHWAASLVHFYDQSVTRSGCSWARLVELWQEGLVGRDVACHKVRNLLVTHACLAGAAHALLGLQAPAKHPLQGEDEGASRGGKGIEEGLQGAGWLTRKWLGTGVAPGGPSPEASPSTRNSWCGLAHSSGHIIVPQCTPPPSKVTGFSV